jgi:hypothetical protein
MNMPELGTRWIRRGQPDLVYVAFELIDDKTLYLKDMEHHRRHRITLDGLKRKYLPEGGMTAALESGATSDNELHCRCSDCKTFEEAIRMDERVKMVTVLLGQVELRTSEYIKTEATARGMLPQRPSATQYDFWYMNDPLEKVEVVVNEEAGVAAGH